MKTDKSFAAARADLVPTPAADRPLTKAQETFRALLARVESLRESIDAEEQEFDANLSFYAEEVVPRLARQTALQKELVRSLAPYLNKTFFPRKEERAEFRELARELLDEIANSERGLIDGDLREIYNAVHGVGYAQDERKNRASVKAALAQAFAEAGMEADFSELDSAASEAEFMARAEAMIARARKMKEVEAEAAHCAEHGHHATEDEHLRAEEEFRKRSIANIYKQLARVLHPDLERDTERQKKKVQLMQELTVAYRQNDLHTLLRLEMQWIENEGGDIDRLTEEKLGVYNEILRDQVQGLEGRLRSLMFHPRYRSIVVFNDGPARVINSPDKARDLDGSIASIECCVARMEAAKTADDVRAAIRSLQERPPAASRLSPSLRGTVSPAE
jgi:hypothetical protein